MSGSLHWIVPNRGLLVLERGAALCLVDASGVELGRFEGALRDELRARLPGGKGAVPAAVSVAAVSKRSVVAHRQEREQASLAWAPPAASPLWASLCATIPALASLEQAQPLTALNTLRGAGWGQLFVELTDRCNERCAHCYASASPEGATVLPRATAEAVVREAAHMGFRVVQFTGGEALLSPDLEDLVELAFACGVPVVEVFTNGLLLNERRYARLRELGASFAFSLYARDPKVHDEITAVTGSHALTVAAIERALAGGSAVRVGIVAVRAELEAEAHEALALAQELGVALESCTFEVSREVGRGSYAGGATGGSSLAPGHASTGGGRACVLPDGAVVPCIFSRDLRLGQVTAEGGLEAALTAPPIRVRADLADAALDERLREGEARLACSGCRLTASLLEPRSRRLPDAAS